MSSKSTACVNGCGPGGQRRWRELDEQVLGPEVEGLVSLAVQEGQEAAFPRSLGNPLPPGPQAGVGSQGPQWLCTLHNCSHSSG